jgi:hypothetical protein
MARKIEHEIPFGDDVIALTVTESRGGGQFHHPVRMQAIQFSPKRLEEWKSGALRVMDADFNGVRPGIEIVSAQHDRVDKRSTGPRSAYQRRIDDVKAETADFIMAKDRSTIAAALRPDAEDTRGFSPLHRERSTEGIRQLVAGGADVNAVDKFGATPLHLPQSADNVRALVDAGADVSKRDQYGRTVLHRQTDPESIQELVRAGVDVNAKDSAGQTALHYARTAEAVQALTKAGADIHAKDEQARTPLHRASSPGVAKALLELGASVSAQDKRGSTPLQSVEGEAKAVMSSFVEAQKAQPEAMKRHVDLAQQWNRHAQQPAPAPTSRGMERW